MGDGESSARLAPAPGWCPLGGASRKAAGALLLAESAIFLLGAGAFLAAFLQPPWPPLSEALHSRWILPLTITMTFFAALSILGQAALRFALPFLLAPSIASSALVQVLLCYIGTECVERLVSSFSASYLLPLLLCVCLILFFIYAISLKIAFFRHLVKKKKAVSGVTEKSKCLAGLEAVAPSATSPSAFPSSGGRSSSASNKFDSFSRRSTIIVSDDLYEPPPRF